MDWAKKHWETRNIHVLWFCATYISDLTVYRSTAGSSICFIHSIINKTHSGNCCKLTALVSDMASNHKPWQKFCQTPRILIHPETVELLSNGQKYVYNWCHVIGWHTQYLLAFSWGWFHRKCSRYHLLQRVSKLHIIWKHYNIPQGPMSWYLDGIVIH